MRTDATKYRPISLVQLLAKLFDTILLERFRKWFTPSDPQTAYQNKRSGADHVFLTRCLIQHAKLYKEKLFVIAIDFDGAFDYSLSQSGQAIYSLRPFTLAKWQYA